MQIEKEIREFLCPYDIKLIMSHRNFTIGKLFPYKDRQSLLHSSGVVYQLTCSMAYLKLDGRTFHLLARKLEGQLFRDVCGVLVINTSRDSFSSESNSFSVQAV